MIQDLGLKLYGVQDLGIQVWDLRFEKLGLRFRMWELKLRS